MNESSIALIGYILLMLVLLTTLLFVRIKSLVSGQHKSSSFDPDGSDVSAFAVRLCRVHANAYENFPIFGGLLLLFLALDLTVISNGLALWFLAARLLQSLTHLLSTSTNAIRIRLMFYLVQCAIAVIWIVKFISLSIQ